MNAMKILGLGQLSACGPGIEPLTGALAGEPPRPEWVATTEGEAPVTAPILRVRAEGTEQLVAGRAMRRLDDFARHFVISTRLAVEDLGTPLPPAERIGVVMGTGYGSLATAFSNLDDIIDYGDATSSPFKFAVSVNNAPSSCVSTVLAARGPCLTVTGFFNLQANVLRIASQWLEWGAGKLANGNDDRPELQKPGEPGYYIRMDRVNYSDGSHPVGGDPWPTEPDPSDIYSLQRVYADQYGNDVINWIWEAPYPVATPGSANPNP